MRRRATQKLEEEGLVRQDRIIFHKILCIDIKRARIYTPGSDRFTIPDRKTQKHLSTRDLNPRTT